MWQQLEPTNWLDEAMLDLSICRLRYRAWHDDYRVWQKFIREA